MQEQREKVKANISNLYKKEKRAGTWSDGREETETLTSHRRSSDFSELLCTTMVRASCVAGPVFDMLKKTRRSNGKL